MFTKEIGLKLTNDLFEFNKNKLAFLCTTKFKYVSITLKVTSNLSEIASV